MHQIIYELHTLLEKAGIAPPYVLVGHSYGGWLVRLYASKYRLDVAGMELLEGGFDNPWRMVNGKLVRAEELATGKPIPPVKTSDPLTGSEIPPDAMKQMKSEQQDWCVARMMRRGIICRLRPSECGSGCCRVGSTWPQR
jgi:pimeloyl-ACP methyl ester carboxylesterase